jgi:hypothetical protein
VRQPAWRETPAGVVVTAKALISGFDLPQEIGLDFL